MRNIRRQALYAIWFLALPVFVLAGGPLTVIGAVGVIKALNARPA